jgi:hypothetical protein
VLVKKYIFKLSIKEYVSEEKYFQFAKTLIEKRDSSIEMLARKKYLHTELSMKKVFLAPKCT